MVLNAIWIGIKKICQWIWSALKWLYRKTKGGILWLTGGLIAGYTIFHKNKSSPVPRIASEEKLQEAINQTVKRAEETSKAAGEAVKHADQVIKEVEERQKKRKKPILPLLMVFLLIVPLTGSVLAEQSETICLGLPQDLQSAYLEQVVIAEEWRQRYLEAEADNDLLIVEIKSLQAQIKTQNESIGHLTTLIKTLNETIESLRSWIGQLYQTITNLTKRNTNFTTSAILKIDNGIRLDGVVVGINW